MKVGCFRSEKEVGVQAGQAAVPDAAPPRPQPARGPRGIERRRPDIEAARKDEFQSPVFGIAIAAKFVSV